MKIEVMKVKSKLTMSMIKQMSVCGFDLLENSELLGYINSTIGRVGLIIHNGDYCRFYLDWKLGECSIYRRVGKGSVTLSYDTRYDCTAAWFPYKRAQKLVLETHIYI